MTPAKTDTRPHVDELPMGAPLPAELQISPPAPPVVEQSLSTLKIADIRPGPHNPRRDLGEMDGMVASIHAVGILEPLIVEREPIGDTCLLLAGHRRLAAAKLAGLTEVPCIVRAAAATPALRMEMALIENLQREGLSPLDEADGYLQLTKLGLSQRQIAERVGCSQSNVSKRMDLLALPAALQSKVGRKKDGLTLEAAAALARLKDHPEKLEAVAKGRAADIIQAVEVAERDIAWEAKRSELVDVAKVKGWDVVDAPQSPYLKRSFATLARWGHSDADLDLDVRKHEAEPCHAVMIPGDRRWPHNDAPSATSVCTQPARHEPKGASTLKAKAAPKAAGPLAATPEQVKLAKQRQAEADARREAADARLRCIVQAVAEHRPTKLTPALRMVLSNMVGMDYDQDDAFVLLGLPSDEDGDTYDALMDYAARGDAELQRVALAIALAEIEGNLRHVQALSPEAVAHYAWLGAQGYEPSPWEKAKLAEAAERSAAGG